MRKSLLASTAAILFTLGGISHAATIDDPKGDWAKDYIGPHQLDLDVIKFSVDYSSVTQSFLLTSEMAGAIDPSLGGFYAIGVNTGTGPASFASIGLGGVRFNSVIAVQKNGTAAISGVALPGGSVTIAGDTLSVVVPLAMLPTTGFDPADYGFNIWPRSGAGGTEVISDFAPDNATLSSKGVSTVPEPAAWAMLITGFGMCGVAFRTRRSVAFS